MLECFETWREKGRGKKRREGIKQREVNLNKQCNAMQSIDLSLIKSEGPSGKNGSIGLLN